MKAVPLQRVRHNRLIADGKASGVDHLRGRGGRSDLDRGDLVDVAHDLVQGGFELVGEGTIVGGLGSEGSDLGFAERDEGSEARAGVLLEAQFETGLVEIGREDRVLVLKGSTLFRHVLDHGSVAEVGVDGVVEIVDLALEGNDLRVKGVDDVVLFGDDLGEKFDFGKKVGDSIEGGDGLGDCRKHFVGIV